MNTLGSLVGETQCEVTKSAVDVATTINDKLTSRKRRLEAELAETNAALEALEQHPDVAKVLTLVGRAIGGRY